MNNTKKYTHCAEKKSQSKRGFSMIETMVAISLLTLSVTAPLTLAGQSLIAANYAKDQITAFNLAQEAVEMVRFHRDNQLICIATAGSNNTVDCTPVLSTNDWLSRIKTSAGAAGNLVGVPGAPVPFTIDTITGNMVACGTPCARLTFQASTGFYSYATGAGFTQSRFTRIVKVTRRAAVVGDPGYDQASVVSEVSWPSGALGTIRRVTIDDELYQWVPSQN
jgi:prepilin-type N-terminal cleavage/methylation domain-containing protein